MARARSRRRNSKFPVFDFKKEAAAFYDSPDMTIYFI
jgi:hypothetical protein